MIHNATAFFLGPDSQGLRMETVEQRQHSLNLFSMFFWYQLHLLTT
jgi:hypothetical protein